jgi:hypothetical protein
MGTTAVSGQATRPVRDSETTCATPPAATAYAISTTTVPLRQSASAVARGEGNGIAPLCTTDPHGHCPAVRTPRSAGFGVSRTVAALVQLPAELGNGVSAALPTRRGFPKVPGESNDGRASSGGGIKS